MSLLGFLIFFYGKKMANASVFFLNMNYEFSMNVTVFATP